MKDKIFKKLPIVLQTPTQKEFFDATVEQLFSERNIEKLQGFVGRKSGSVYDVEKDKHISAPNFERSAYQLEPMSFSKDLDVEDTNQLFYQDFVNYLKFNGGNVDNHDRLFSESYYSFSPPIDVDKFINYQNYIWIGNAEPVLNIPGIDDSQIESLIIGSKNFNTDQVNNSLDNFEFTSGIRVKFVDSSSYNEPLFVEGVGRAIDLVPEPKPIVIENVSDSDVEDILSGEVTNTNDIQNATPSDIVFTNGMLVVFPDSSSYTEPHYLERIVNLQVGFGADSRLPRPTIIPAQVSDSPDYITTERTSKNPNAWSISNRWVHIDAINAMIEADPSLDFQEVINNRGLRPILEFKRNLELYASTTIIQEKTGNASQTSFTLNQVLKPDELREILINDLVVDPDTYQVIYSETAPTTVVFDSAPEPNDNIVFVKNIFDNKAITETNIAPRFNLYDYKGVELGDLSEYPNSNFRGNKIFSYRTDTSLPRDPVLGLPVITTGFGEVNDIVFENNTETERYNFRVNGGSVRDINGYYFFKEFTDDGFELRTNWKSASEAYKQRVVERYLADGETNTFALSVSPEDQDVEVIVDGVTLAQSDFNYDSADNSVVLNTEPSSNSIVETFTYTHDTIPDDASAFFEIPAALQNNPQNQDILSGTWNDFSRHFISSIQRQDGFEGDSFGTSNNFRDTEKEPGFGQHILQTRAPLLKGMLMASDDDLDILKSIDFSSREYTRYKNKIVKFTKMLINEGFTPFNIGDQIPVTLWVDEVIKRITKSREFTNAFANTNMLAWSNLYKEEALSSANGEFTLTEFIDLTQKNNVMYVYLNDELLVIDRDYTITNSDSVIDVTVHKPLTANDTVVFRLYEEFSPAHVPATPSKVGIYPVFVPRIELDETYPTPTEVIVGHDGSRIPVFGDYTDDVLLEFEKRIYNGIINKFRVDYDIPLRTETAKPGFFRTTRWSREEWLKLSKPVFYKWATYNEADFRTNEFFDISDEWTWNYSGLDFGGFVLQGSWRSLFDSFYDTQTPHITPWEMLGFSEEPIWWEDEYGPGPWPDTHPMWEDIEAGEIKSGNRAGIDTRFARPGLVADHLPVDVTGALKSTPLECIGYSGPQPTQQQISAPWKYGDIGPVEHVWTVSETYPYHMSHAKYLSRPAAFAENFWDPEHFVRLSIDPQQVVSDENGVFKRVGNQGLLVDGETSNGQKVSQTGYQVFVTSRLRSLSVDIESDFGNLVRNVDAKLAHKVSGFTNQETLRVFASGINTSSTATNLLIPSENINVDIYTSKPIREYFYGGVLVRALPDGRYQVFGYDSVAESFTINPRKSSIQDKSVTVGGTPAQFSIWESSKTFTKGSIVKLNSSFYQALETTQSTRFDPEEWRKLPELPTVGGVTVVYKPQGVSETVEVEYGTVLPDPQSVFDFIVSYGDYLESQGFEFDEYDAVSGKVRNWFESAKEFLFWVSTQWEADSVITLSPSASKVTLTTKEGYPSNIEKIVNGSFSILDQNGVAIDPNSVRIQRDGRTVICTPLLEGQGIFSFRVNTTETESIVSVDNVTKFDDTINDPVFGIRQERLLLNGIRTLGWTGKLEAGGYLITQDGLVPNFENLVNSVRNYHNTEKSVDNPQLEDVARHLIGYQERQYFNDLELADDNQYLFYQSFIREKGTTGALSALQRSKVVSRTDDVLFEVKDEWALKVGEYGAVCEDITTEFLLRSDEIRANTQLVELSFPSSRGETISITREIEPVRNLSSFGSNADFRTGLGFDEGVAEQESSIVTPDSEWGFVSTGKNHSLAIATDGTLWTWGSNEFGKTGLDTNSGETQTPTQIGTDSDWALVSAGRDHSVAIKNDGTLWAWGRNQRGQLGITTFDDELEPIQVGTDSDWKVASAGGVSTNAVKTNGELYGWGGNDQGQAGNDIAVDTNAPVQIGSDTDWEFVVSGIAENSHAFAIKTDNTLWVWGNNEFGKTGLNTDSGDSGTSEPTQVGSDNDWLTVSAGVSHSLAVKTDFSVWAAGSNEFGKTGLGTSSGETLIFTTLGFDSIKSVSAGENHSIAVNTDEELLVWGKASVINQGTGNIVQPKTLEGVDSVLNASAGNDFTILIRNIPIEEVIKVGTAKVVSINLIESNQVWSEPPEIIIQPHPEDTKAPVTDTSEKTVAKAVAILGDDNKIKRIEITDPGSGYSLTPRVFIGSTELEPSSDRAIAIIQFDVVEDEPRTDVIKIDVDDNTRWVTKPSTTACIPSDTLWPLKQEQLYNTPNAGYVHIDDVDYSIFSDEQLGELWDSPNPPELGDTIHIAKNAANRWNVYTVQDVDTFNFVEVQSVYGTILFNTDLPENQDGEVTVTVNQNGTLSNPELVTSGEGIDPSDDQTTLRITSSNLSPSGDGSGATLQFTTVSGQIDTVDDLSPGSGYGVPFEQVIEVPGASSQPATIGINTNASGNITGANIVNPGVGYTQTRTISVPRGSNGLIEITPSSDTTIESVRVINPGINYSGTRENALLDNVPSPSSLVSANVSVGVAVAETANITVNLKIEPIFTEIDITAEGINERSTIQIGSIRSLDTVTITSGGRGYLADNGTGSGTITISDINGLGGEIILTVTNHVITDGFVNLPGQGYSNTVSSQFNPNNAAVSTSFAGQLAQRVPQNTISSVSVGESNNFGYITDDLRRNGIIAIDNLQVAGGSGARILLYVSNNRITSGAVVIGRGGSGYASGTHSIDDQIPVDLTSASAVIRVNINSNGQVTSATATSRGRGYFTSQTFDVDIPGVSGQGGRLRISSEATRAADGKAFSRVSEVSVVDTGFGYAVARSFDFDAPIPSGAPTPARLGVRVDNTGQVSDVRVIGPGRGYTQPSLIELEQPEFDFVGTGAVIEFSVSNGRVVDPVVLSGGSNYLPETEATIRVPGENILSRSYNIDFSGVTVSFTPQTARSLEDIGNLITEAASDINGISVFVVDDRLLFQSTRQATIEISAQDLDSQREWIQETGINWFGEHRVSVRLNQDDSVTINGIGVSFGKGSTATNIVDAINAQNISKVSASVSDLGRVQISSRFNNELVISGSSLGKLIVSESHNEYSGRFSGGENHVAIMKLSQTQGDFGFIGGADYEVGDLITLETGTQVRVDNVDGSGVITEFTVERVSTVPNTIGTLIQDLVEDVNGEQSSGTGFQLFYSEDNVDKPTITLANGAKVSVTRIIDGVVEMFVITESGQPVNLEAIPQESVDIGSGTGFEIIPESINVESTPQTWDRDIGVSVVFTRGSLPETRLLGQVPNQEPGLCIFSNRIFQDDNDRLLVNSVVIQGQEYKYTLIDTFGGDWFYVLSQNGEPIEDNTFGEITNIPVQVLYSLRYSDFVQFDDEELGSGDLQQNPLFALEGEEQVEYVWIDQHASGWEVRDIIERQTHRSQQDLVNTELFVNSFVYDSVTQDVIARLPVFDPYKGLIPGAAGVNLTYQTISDPARYTNSSEPRLVSDKVFDRTNVGQTWWDQSTAAYYLYEQGTNRYRRDNWGRLVPGSEIDVYEWVRSTESPEDYTGEGEPKNLTDFVQTQEINPVTNELQTFYYFWVKGLTSIPALPGRTLSVSSVANLIRNPTGQGYRWFSPVNQGAFVISTGDRIFDDSDNILQINYRKESENNNVHVEWELAREDDLRYSPNQYYWDRITDSLAGITRRVPLSGDESFSDSSKLFNNYVDALISDDDSDTGYLLVPATDLNSVNRYGVSIRPRQTMFVNMFAARRVFVDTVNTLISPILTRDLNENWNDGYNTETLWEWVDWWEEGFNRDNSAPSRRVNNVAELSTITDAHNGEVVLVMGTRRSLYVFDSENNGFKLIYREKSRLSLKSRIYTQSFSLAVSIELRELIAALKDNVLTSEMKNKLFFAMLNYVFSEQDTVDWAFKTSFVAVIQGKQTITDEPFFVNEPTESINQYVQEAIPYHTQVRQFITVKTPDREDLDATVSEVLFQSKMKMWHDRFRCSLSIVEIRIAKSILGFNGYTELSDGGSPISIRLGAAGRLAASLARNKDAIPSISSSEYSDFFTGSTPVTQDELEAVSSINQQINQELRCFFEGVNLDGFSLAGTVPWDFLNWDVDPWDGSTEPLITNMEGSPILILKTDQTQDNYDGESGNGVFTGGQEYVVGDTITLTNRAVITVNLVDGSGAVTEFTVKSPGFEAELAEELTPNEIDGTQETSGSGTDFSLTPGVNNLTASMFDPSPAQETVADGSNSFPVTTSIPDVFLEVVVDGQLKTRNVDYFFVDGEIFFVVAPDAGSIIQLFSYIDAGPLVNPIVNENLASEVLPLAFNESLSIVVNRNVP